MNNLILVDWLTFTSKIYSISDIISIFHLDKIVFEEIDSYRYGYSHRAYYEGISILSGGRDDMGICVELSGKGCRCFEDFSTLSWFEVFGILADDFNEFNVTRLDLAFDDRSGILDLEILLDDTDQHNYRSRSRWWLVEYGSCGTSIYHGSPRSNFRVRIYDKAAERGLLDGTHWIRVEIVLRDENASGAIDSILKYMSLGKVFSGLLSNYLVYCIPTDDTNHSRWPVAEYWQHLIDAVDPIHIATRVGLEYNIFHLESLIRDQFSGAIYTWIQINGLDSLETLIRSRKSKLNPKYIKLLEENKKGGLL